MKSEKYYKIQNLKSDIELNLIMLEFLNETPIDDVEYDDLVFMQDKKLYMLLHKYYDLINENDII